MAAVLGRPSRLFGPEPNWLVDALFVATLSLHGPVDIGLAALTWGFEGNTLVSQLGLWPWLAIKAVALVAAVFVWVDHRRASPEPYPVTTAYLLGILSALAVVLILPNAFIAAEVLA